MSDILKSQFNHMQNIPKSQEEWRQWIVADKPSLTRQLAVWLYHAQSLQGLPSEWDRCELRAEGVAILLRNSTNDVLERCFVIATVQIELEAQRKGLFKAFLKECWRVNPWHRLVIEDVSNPHLTGFLQKINASKLSDFYPTTFEVHRTLLSRFSCEPLKV